MHHLKAFEVDITPPEATLTYELDDTFFELFEESLVEKGQLKVTLQVHRARSNVHLSFHIIGTIVLICDRSLATFDYPIELDRKIKLTFGHKKVELAADLYMIEQHTTRLNVAQHLYDFISLAVPMKRLHPRFEVELQE